MRRHLSRIFEAWQIVKFFFVLSIAPTRTALPRAFVRETGHALFLT